jgi:hypothetical protein
MAPRGLPVSFQAQVLREQTCAKAELLTSGVTGSIVSLVHNIRLMGIEQRLSESVSLVTSSRSIIMAFYALSGASDMGY